MENNEKILNSTEASQVTGGDWGGGVSDIGCFKIDPGRCTCCRACQEVCPSGSCVEIDNTMTIRGTCTGCGECVVVCPTYAIVDAY